MRQLPRLLLATLLTVPVLVACGPRNAKSPVPGVNELAEDPILLSRVLERCNANPASFSTPECINARSASDRVSAVSDAERARKAQAGFEQARDARRRVEDGIRQAEEARKRALQQAEPPP